MTRAATTADPLHVVTIGDSEAKNSHCPGCKAYNTLVEQKISAEQNRPVASARFTVGGNTSADLMTQLQTPAVGAALTSADLALVQIGANDFSHADAATCRDTIESCYGTALATTRTKLTTGLRHMADLMRHAKAQIVVVGYPNVLKDGAPGRAKGADYMVGEQNLTRAVDAVMKQAADTAGAIYVDAYTPLKGTNGDAPPDEYLAADGDHLNATGHATVADAILRRLGPLTSTL